jgi:hypothetical protein
MRFVICNYIRRQYPLIKELRVFAVSSCGYARRRCDDSRRRRVYRSCFFYARIRFGLACAFEQWHSYWALRRPISCHLQRRSSDLERFNQPLCVRLSRDQLKAVDALARARNMRRGEYLRELVQAAIDGKTHVLTRKELKHLSFISAGVDVILGKVGGVEGQAAAQAAWDDNFASLTGTVSRPAAVLQDA